MTTRRTAAVFYLEEGISAGCWTASGAVETSVGQFPDRGAGGRCCSGPVTAVWPGFQLLGIKPQLSCLKGFALKNNLQAGFISRFLLIYLLQISL